MSGAFKSAGILGAIVMEKQYWFVVSLHNLVQVYLSMLKYLDAKLLPYVHVLLFLENLGILRVY